jgi:hypothetical protein
MDTRQPLGEILVQLKAIRPHDVERILAALALRPRRPKFGQMARDMGLIREEHVLAALAVQMDLFPGIDRLSLQQILQYLLTAQAV